MKEARMEKKLIQACRTYGVKSIKGDARQHAGYPDRVIYNTKRGLIHHVELKADTNYKQTVLQNQWEMIIKQSGGDYFLINGVTELNEYINKYLK